jgi:hypothetical protein
MFKRFALAAALAGVLLIGPAAFAQQYGHDGRAAGTRGFSGGRDASRPAISGRAFSGGRAYYGGGYGGYGAYGRGYYAGPRVGVGLGYYGPSCYPGYPCPGYGAPYLGLGYRDRIGYGARFYGERPGFRGEAFARSGRRPR